MERTLLSVLTLLFVASVVLAKPRPHTKVTMANLGDEKAFRLPQRQKLVHEVIVPAVAAGKQMLARLAPGQRMLRPAGPPRRGTGFRPVQRLADEKKGTSVFMFEQEFNGIRVMGGELNDIEIKPRDFQPLDKATKKAKGPRKRVAASRRLNGVVVEGLEVAVGNVDFGALERNKGRAEQVVKQKQHIIDDSGPPRGGAPTPNAGGPPPSLGGAPQGGRNPTLGSFGALHGGRGRRMAPKQKKRLISSETIIFVDPALLEASAGHLVKTVHESENDIKFFSTVVDKDGTIIKEWDNTQTQRPRPRRPRPGRPRPPACGKRNWKERGIGPGGNQKIGKHVYGQNKPKLLVGTVCPNGPFRWRNVRRGANRNQCQMQTSNVVVTNLKNGDDTKLVDPFKFRCNVHDSDPVNGGYSPLNDAKYYGERAVRMYSDWYGEAPTKLPVQMKVHFKKNYQNAYYDPEIGGLVFGDGGQQLFPTVAMDVVGHELAHAVTDKGSQLWYEWESGGINEAFSDMAGKAAVQYEAIGTNTPTPDFIRNFDWGVATDIFKSDQSLRYMDDPTKDGFSIDHVRDFRYQEPCYVDYVSTGQCTSIHHSSGIFNKVFHYLANQYLYAAWDAFDIFYVANTRGYWTQYSDFANGAAQVMQAAEDIFNGVHFDNSYEPLYVQHVINAFREVGLGCDKAEGFWQCAKVF